jgi:peptidoglycan/xylan/chitin deacetylase (PgdA/CDA1 family)
MNRAERILTSLLIVSAIAVAHAGCKSSDPAADTSCTGAQALSKTGLTGASMPLKSLSLTFDDGPGARTIELATYLKEQGIRATFFIYGEALKNEGAGSTILQKVIDNDHLIANHTQHHLSLTQAVPTPLSEAQIVAELTELDAMLTPLVKNDIWLFRPPYGDWNDAAAAALEKTPMKKYVGPILWNVGGTMGANSAADAQCWRGATLTTVENCGDLYVKEIDAVGKGIVLMHDPYFIEQNNPESGGTWQMVQYIVPILKAKGYTFVRLDEVPEIAALLPGAPPPDAGAVAPGTDEPITPDEGTSGGTTPEPCP